MALLWEIVGCFVLTAMVYILIHAFGDIEPLKEVIFSAVFLGCLLALLRREHESGVGVFDKVGVFAAGLYFVGACAKLVFDIDRGGQPPAEAAAAITIVFRFIFFSVLPAMAIYGYFGFLSLIMPAYPDGRPGREPEAYGEADRDPRRHDRSGSSSRADAGARRSRRDPYARGSRGTGRRDDDRRGPASYGEPPPRRYTTNLALHLFKESGVEGPPSETRAANALGGHCLASLGPRAGMDFLNQAARDDDLPKRTRQFFAHALQEMERAGVSSS